MAQLDLVGCARRRGRVKYTVLYLALLALYLALLALYAVLQVFRTPLSPPSDGAPGAQSPPLYPSSNHNNIKYVCFTTRRRGG